MTRTRTAKAADLPPAAEIRDRVAEDPDRVPVEKETGILFSRVDERATVHSSGAGLMRRLLKHPEFELDRAEVTRDGDVVTVFGTVPVGCVKIQSNARQSNRGSDLVSPSVDTGGGGDGC